jgi:hypothetical protein
MRNRTLPLALLSLGILLASGCSASGTGDAGDASAAGNMKNAKGVAPAKICQMLADPVFESRFEYNGSSCSGSTHFGTKDTRTMSSATDMRPAFSFLASGDQDAVNRVALSMSKRDDDAARQFFLTEAHAVARMIGDQPLPKDIESAITAPLSTSGGEFKTASKLGNATVELRRSATDSLMYLSFAF